MSTNSTISIKHGEGDYESVYCHWDGYPAWNGQLLYTFYDTADKVNALLEQGYISSLGANIGEYVPMDSFESEDIEKKYRNFQCSFYKRDRGEKGVDKQHYSSLEECEMQAYNYLFDETDGKWYLIEDGKQTPLINVLIKDYQESGQFFEPTDIIGGNVVIGEVCTPEQIDRLAVLCKELTGVEPDYGMYKKNAKEENRNERNSNHTDIERD